MGFLLRWVVALVLSVATCAAHATPGELDATFGTGGIVHTQFSNAANDAYAVAVQADGRIVTGGRAVLGSIDAAFLSRYLPDGRLDTSFGNRGIVLASLAQLASVTSLAIQPDGRIVAAIYTFTDNNSVITVARFGADGKLDPAFGRDGVAEVPVGNNNAQPSAVAVQPDGRIVVSGRVNANGAGFVLRLLAGGGVDPSFGNNGTVMLSFESYTTFNDVALLADGRIVVAGSAQLFPGTNGTHGMVARLLGNGSLDTSFGDGGVAYANWGSSTFANALAVAPDGSLLIGGGYSFTQQALLLSRFTAEGQADTRFGSGGRMTVANAGTYVRDLAIQADGSALVVGTEDYADGTVVKVTPAGALDPAFGSVGIARIGVSSGVDKPTALALLGSGRVAVAGLATPANEPSDQMLLVLRSDGTLDGAFASTGFALLDAGADFTLARAVALQGDGKIVAAGGLQGALARYLADGSLDATFGVQGRVPARDIDVRALALMPDGKIAIAGEKLNAQYRADMVIARFLANGAPDTGFGVNGEVVISIDPRGPSGALAIAAQPDGRLVVAGYGNAGARDSMAMVRLLADGSIDGSFDGGKLHFAFGNWTDRINAVTLQPDGKVVIAGFVQDTSSGGTSFAIARFTSGGRLDTSFNGTGKARAFSTSAVANSVVVMPDGRIVAAGVERGPGNDDFAIARFLPDGTPDGSFGGGGKQFVDFGAQDTAFAAQALPDGRIALAGVSGTPAGIGLQDTRVAVTVLGTNGAPDNGFGSGGRALQEISLFDDRGFGLAVQPSGALVVAAGATGRFTLLRLQGPAAAPADPGADTDSDGVPDTVEATEGLDRFVKDNDIFDRSRLFAMQQYRDFLGREGDAGGVDYHAARLQDGSATRLQVIEEFLGSGEFQNGLPQCARLYFSFFLRIPDYAGLMYQVAAYRSGTPLEVISQNFSGSPEFQSRYGSLTNEQYVDLVYQNVLGRPADASGRQYYLDRLNDGRLTRGQMMVGFSESPEFQQIVSDEVYVTSVYVGMLRRTPDQSGMDFYVNQFENGAPRNSIVSGFLGSAEYRARFLP